MGYCGNPEMVPNLNNDLSEDLDYVGLIHRHLNISANEKRFNTIEDQPEGIRQRLYKLKPLPG